MGPGALNGPLPGARHPLFTGHRGLGLAGKRWQRLTTAGKRGPQKGPAKEKAVSPCDSDTCDASCSSLSEPDGACQDTPKGMEAAGIEPASPDSQCVCDKQFSDSDIALAAVWQRNGGSNCHCLTSTDALEPNVGSPSIDYIRSAWPHIAPHIREAVLTLIDAALTQRDKRDETTERTSS